MEAEKGAQLTFNMPAEFNVENEQVNILNYLLEAKDTRDGFLKSVPIEICTYLVNEFPELVDQKTMDLSIQNAPALVKKLSGQFQITFTPAKPVAWATFKFMVK